MYTLIKFHFRMSKWLKYHVYYHEIFTGVYIIIVQYQYYYGMMDHSGIKMDAFWPWQPPTIFHDNHHK